MGGQNMEGRCIACEERPAPPRVVVVGLATAIISRRVFYIEK